MCAKALKSIKECKGSKVSTTNTQIQLIIRFTEIFDILEMPPQNNSNSEASLKK